MQNFFHQNQKIDKKHFLSISWVRCIEDIKHLTGNMNFLILWITTFVDPNKHVGETPIEMMLHDC